MSSFPPVPFLRPGILALLAALACVAGCTPVNAPQPRAEGEEQIVGEKSDARSRARARTELAAAYYEAGSMGIALEEVRTALEADSNYAPAHNVYGLVQMELKDLAGADRSFRRARELAPQDADVSHNYGWFLCQSGREAQSVEHFLAAAANPLYTTPAKSYAAAGGCLLRLKRNDEALQYLERALRLDPNYAPAALSLARLYMQRGTLDQARGLMTRLNNTLQPSAESLWVALNIERRRGDADAEESLAAQLRRRFPEAPETQALRRGQFE